MNSRTFATLSAALLMGAGGGVGASLAFDRSGPTTRIVSAAPSTGLRPAADTSALTVNAIYRGAKQGVVDITATSPGARAEGSGFVIDGTGNIVTNQHVVSGASTLSVKFADGTRAAARVVGQDASSDLAVIRVSGVSGAHLKPLPLGDSSKAQVGDGVIAIGSPYGLAGSLTVGVISALDRSIDAPNHYAIAGAIQTDAAINHGNSGGPLLDSQGRVIGVNSQIDSGSGDNSGVGFAIPSNTVQRVVGQLLGGNQVQHAFLGLQLGDAPAGGASVGGVTGGSPAATAGIASGDLVTAVDGRTVAAAADVVSFVQAHKPGDTLTLTIHHVGSSRDVRVTLADRSS